MTERLVLIAIALAAVSGVPGVALGRGRMAGQWIAALLAIAGSGLGLAGLVRFWVFDESQPIVFPWQLPGAEFNVAVDGLSAVFLLPIFVVTMMGQIYGLAYWKQTDYPQNGRKLRFFYGFLTAGMALLVISRNGILFLFAWEIMALAAFFLVATEDEKADVREAGWIYLVATHTATLFLLALFALFAAANGSYNLVPLAEDAVSPTMATVMFLLALVGFGMKAGVMPLHVWLPGSHSIAPSHVSATMSGVIIKMGVYGLFRTLSLLPTPPIEWGAALMTLGAISGVLGIAFAIGQQDLKRLLAYCSIENIGIILLGLGLAVIGRSQGRADLVVLGVSGSLLHVWNHAFFKSLLFLSAGSVIHATHTREVDAMGGLAKAMPWTAAGFLVGSIAICGLPPLNGFVSEYLIYLSLFQLLGQDNASFAGATLAAAALALVGTLAVACFVKAYGAVFLGVARTQPARQARESGVPMLVALGVLSACCFSIALGPLLLTGVFDKAVAAWAPGMAQAAPRLATLAPFDWLTTMAVVLIAAVVVGRLLLGLLLRHNGATASVTWGCGYSAGTPRVQYTSSSFAQILVGLFSWALRPQVHKPGNLPLFPRHADFHSEVGDIVLDEAVMPSFAFTGRQFSRFRVFQQGNIQTYLLYIFIALIVLLLWR